MKQLFSDIYTKEISKVGRKMSGELAQAVADLREHKRIPKFDTPTFKMSKVYNKKIVILSRSKLLIDSIKDNLPLQNELSIEYITDEWESRINSYDKIDLLITDFNPKDFKDWHKIKTIANIGKDTKISEDEISLNKPFKLNSLFKVIEKASNNRDIFCNINNDFVYNEHSQNISSAKQSIKLTEKENKIFRFILLSNGFATEKESLLKHVWQYNENTESSTVDTHLYKLKAKLPDNMLRIKNNVYQLNIIAI